MTGLQWLLVYLAAANLLALLLCGLDKSYAKREGHRRIPERTLLLTAALGGSIGMLLGMYRFHHKTKHAKFYIGVPVILLLQLLAAWYLLK